MFDIKRMAGKTRIITPGICLTSDRINRDRYNELRKQVKKIKEDIDSFQSMLAKALSQGKRQ